MLVVDLKWSFFFVSVEEPQLSLSRLDHSVNEDAPLPSQLENEGDTGTAVRPSVTSGYSKQFQKSLPPRFLRQQVLTQCPGFVCCLLPISINVSLNPVKDENVQFKVTWQILFVNWSSL